MAEARRLCAVPAQEDALEPPEHLSERSQGFWRETVSEYALDPHHVELLRRLCEAMDRCDEAVRLLGADGPAVTDRFGVPKGHPAVAIERDSRIAVARLLRELDLDGAGPAVKEARPPRVVSQRRAKGKYS